MSDADAIEDMLRHYNGWPPGYVAQHPEALNLARSIGRMVDGLPWRLGENPPAPETPAEETKPVAASGDAGGAPEDPVPAGPTKGSVRTSR